MAEFAYNNAKNASTNHMPYKFNYGYHLRIFYKKDFNLCSKSKVGNELAGKLKNLMTLYWENFYNTQELQKRAHDKGVKPRSYIFGDKVL